MTTSPLSRADRIQRSRLWAACWRGEAPAEALPADERDALVHELLTLGWTVDRIAAHTRMTTYTASRIVERLKSTRGADR